MAIALFQRSGLNPREQRVATFAVFVLGFFVLLGIPVGVQMLVSSRKSDNEELRAALTAVNGARPQIRERKAKKESIAQRYAKKAPPLAGYLGQEATKSKLQVTESVDRPDVPVGKKYTERQSVVQMKKTGLLPLATFLEGLEKSGLPIAVSRLNVRKRAAEADSFDVEVGVSAYDRNEAAPAKDAEKNP